MRIKAAAIKSRDGVVHSLPPPNRHHNIIKLLRQSNPLYTVLDTKEQGFITDDDVFVDRYQARIIATAANQLLPLRDNGYVGDQLFSEDVW